MGILGKLQIPGVFQFAEKGRILHSHPVDLIQDDELASFGGSVSQRPEESVPVIGARGGNV
jgi:hypothetical protein